MKHRPEDLVTLFNSQFRESFGTELIRGQHEPEYLPASSDRVYAQVVFAHGYFASALHEISHWCIAGDYRRTLADYGYWYCPDGRSEEQQRAFEQVEVKPQALEWLFSVASRSRFHISVDNLEGCGATDEEGFRRSVFQQACRYLDQSLPTRAGMFLATLKTFYGTTDETFIKWRTDNTNLAGYQPHQVKTTRRDTETYDTIT